MELVGVREGVHFKFRLAAEVRIVPKGYIYDNGVANVFRFESIFRLLYCARYDELNYATKRADMQEKIMVATKSSL